MPVERARPRGGIIALFEPRDYQVAAVRDAVDFLRTATPGSRRWYTAPTGSGKSLVMLMVRDALPGLWVVTPRLEIAADLLRKDGLEPPTSRDALVELAASRRIVTPIRLRNLMLRGDFEPPPALAVDEAHHDTSGGADQLRLLSGTCPSVGYTATPFRATPESTAALRALWGEPVVMLTWARARELGVVSTPTCHTIPLVDDDVLVVSGGEFAVRSVEAATLSRLDHAAAVADAWNLDRPTVACLPSRDSARAFAARLSTPSDLVLGDTPLAARQAAFARCVAGKSLLVQVEVVSEGVDLPLRRFYDLSPTASPVRWLQRLGRCTRPVAPGEPPPEYVCCNRNLSRHAYLLEGAVPDSAIAESQAAFGGPSTRAGWRVFGMEPLGRLRACLVPLAGGLSASAWAVSASGGEGTRLEYFCLVHPSRPRPLWAARQTVAVEGAPRQYGRWVAVSPPSDLRGFASQPAGELSEKQRLWWRRAARRHGLDPEAEVNSRNFVALPVLSDLRARV